MNWLFDLFMNSKQSLPLFIIAGLVVTIIYYFTFFGRTGAKRRKGVMFLFQIATLLIVLIWLFIIIIILI